MQLIEEIAERMISEQDITEEVLYLPNGLRKLSGVMSIELAKYFDELPLTPNEFFAIARSGVSLNSGPLHEMLKYVLGVDLEKMLALSILKAVPYAIVMMEVYRRVPYTQYQTTN